MARLEWSVGALADIDEIAEFISSRSPGFGPFFVRRVVAAAERLGEFPRLGRVLPEHFPEGFRELVFQNYRIVYRHTGEQVVILGVWHGAVDLESHLRNRPWHIT